MPEGARIRACGADAVTTRQRVHQQKRRADGKCAVEGCDVYTGEGYRCIEHKREHRKRMRIARSGGKRAESA